MDNLNGIRVAILAENGFEQVELTEPRKALDQAGAQTRIVSSRSPRVRGWQFTESGEELPVDTPLDGARRPAPGKSRYGAVSACACAGGDSDSGNETTGRLPAIYSQ